MTTPPTPSPYTGRYSREALTARLGEEVMADLRRIAAEAPEPAPEQLQLLRRLFAPSIPLPAATQANSSVKSAP